MNLLITNGFLSLLVHTQMDWLSQWVIKNEFLDGTSCIRIFFSYGHDDNVPAMLQKIDLPQYFSELLDSKVIEIQGHSVTLCHYPMLEKNSRKYGSRKFGYLIHGHMHNRVLPLYDTLYSQGNALNAGADINGFEPVSFDELLANNERFKLSVLPNSVDKALFLCRSYHMHQCDKSGVSYAEHPIHVASRLDTEECKIVALLHDTLEDTTLSLDLLRELFGDKYSGRVAGKSL